MPLGERLVRGGLLSPAQLERALALQQRDGGRLGDILIGEGMMGYLPLYRAVAEIEGLPFVDLLHEPPDDALPQPEDREDYLRLRMMPWRRDGAVLVVAVCEVTLEVMTWLRVRYGSNTRLAITSPLDIHRMVVRLFGGQLQEDSCLKLWKNTPHASARSTLLPRQQVAAWALLLGVVAGVATSPALAALAFLLLCHSAYTATLLFKCGVYGAGLRKQNDNWAARLATLDVKQLPVYTVLIPMYREAESLPGMLAAMGALDYPAAKLDIKLVLEADDTVTLAEAERLRPGYRFDIIRVPPCQPRTKPKACNYALRFARGEFVTIYDADDRPDPLQLKKAVWMFRNMPGDVVCLQARLNYYNAEDNLLTRFFALEYHVLFDTLLAGLERLSIPIPLGGTSNHFYVQRLRDLGEWDPYNVTEDADLGVRITAQGLRTAMLDSDTMEEAPVRVGAWLKQRSRWIKGYMQTWLVHMRRPVALYRTLGLKSFLGFQLFVGLSTFTFLSAPLVWGVSLAWWGVAGQLPDWLAVTTLVNLALHLGSSWWFTLRALRGRHASAAMRRAALLFPLYLLLHSVASYKALWQLIVNPHYWEKTMHGLTRRTPPQPAFASLS